MDNLTGDREAAAPAWPRGTCAEFREDALPGQHELEEAASEFTARFDALVVWLRTRGVDLDDRAGSPFRRTLIAQRELESALDMAAISRAVEYLRAA
jgi:hypothetical protein